MPIATFSASIASNCTLGRKSLGFACGTAQGSNAARFQALTFLH